MSLVSMTYSVDKHFHCLTNFVIRSSPKLLKYRRFRYLRARSWLLAQIQLDEFHVFRAIDQLAWEVSLHEDPETPECNADHEGETNDNEAEVDDVHDEIGGIVL